MVSDQILELDVDILQPNPLQPRGLITPESLVDLVDSIREQGILEPLIIAKTPAGYQIIAGERRWRASKIAGLSKVPVIVRETTPQEMMEMAIVENIQRVDLNPLERALAFKRLIDEFGLRTSEIARRIGKSEAYVSNSLRLLILPDVLKDGLLSGVTTEGHVRALTALEDPRVIVEAYKIVLQQNLSVRGAEELTRKLKAAGKAPLSSRAKVSTTNQHSDELEEIQGRIAQNLIKFGIKAQAKISQSRVQGKLVLLLKGSQESTSEVLRKIDSAIGEISK